MEPPFPECCAVNASQPAEGRGGSWGSLANVELPLSFPSLLIPLQGRPKHIKTNRSAPFLLPIAPPLGSLFGDTFQFSPAGVCIHCSFQLPAPSSTLQSGNCA